MNERLVVRHRRRQKTPIDLRALCVPAGGGHGVPATALAGVAAPHLGMPEPASSRSALVSGSLSVLAHLILLLALVIFAWLNPDLMEKVIPVQLIKELPGSNEEPAPVRPKTLKPRTLPQQTVAPRAVQQVIAPRQTLVSPETIEMARVDPAAVPTQIQHRNVTAQQVRVQSSIDGPRVFVNPSAVSGPVVVRPTDLRAPVTGPTGPVTIDTRAPAVAAPQFTDFERAAPVQHQASAQLSTTQTTDTGVTGIGIETSVDDAFMGVEGTGGTGVATGVVRCQESAYVQRYYQTVRDRTLERWEVPAGTPSEEKVVLRFQLDASGSATRVEFVRAENRALGESAVAALRSASPFPAMGSEVRCIAGQPLNATFSVPAL